MLGLYLAALGFAGVVMAVSVVFGHGKDFGKGSHAHVDHVEADHGEFDPPWWLPFASFRFWTFGALAFGLTGTLSSFLIPEPFVAGLAGGMGLGVGLMAARLFAHLVDEVVTAPTVTRAIGQEGRVLLPIASGVTGRVLVETSAGRIEMAARSRDPAPIAVGATVLIVSIDHTTAEVTAIDGVPAAQRAAARPREPAS